MSRVRWGTRELLGHDLTGRGAFREALGVAAAVVDALGDEPRRPPSTQGIGRIKAGRVREKLTSEDDRALSRLVAALSEQKAARLLGVSPMSLTRLVDGGSATREVRDKVAEGLRVLEAPRRSSAV